MSKNEKTTTCADALAANGLIYTRALSLEVSTLQEDFEEIAHVGSAPLSEENPALENGTDEGVSERSPASNALLSEGMHWLEPDTLLANPLSELIYGNDMTGCLLASVREDGIQSPLVVCKDGLKVISGNTRLRVAKELGMAKVPVLFVEGELTSEEERNLVLSHNVAREKTNEMKVREYRCYLEIEKGQAKQRAAAVKKGSVKVPNLAPAKSRDVAADKVGGTHSSLQTGLKVVEAIDRLTADGRVDEVNRLRNVLNEKGYSPAKNLAVMQRWLVEDKPKGEVGSKSASKSEPPPAAVFEPSPTPTVGKGTKTEHQEALQAGSELATERAQAAGVPQQGVDSQALDALFKALDEVEVFLSGEDVALLSEELKARIGARLGTVNALAICGGITIKAS